MNLGELLRDAAAALPDVVVTTGPDDALTWSRAGRPFAVLGADGSAVEFGLDSAVATAAMRTPDVMPSARRSGWVHFQPTVVDDHSSDRAVAWFVSAHRRLGNG